MSNFGWLALLIISWSYFPLISLRRWGPRSISPRPGRFGFLRCYEIRGQTLPSVEGGALFGAWMNRPSIYLHGTMVACIYLDDMRALDPVGHVQPARFKLSMTARLQTWYRRSGGICLSVGGADCGRVWEDANSSALPGPLEWRVSGHCTTAGRSLIVSVTTKLVWCHVLTRANDMLTPSNSLTLSTQRVKV